MIIQAIATGRAVVLSLIASMAVMAAGSIAMAAPPGFVETDGTRFTIDGQDYTYVGANMWYGAYLGADTDYGDRARLGRELDRLKALGVTNLRVLGSSELSPLKNSVRPTFRDETGVYNEELLTGLDYLLAEMAKRDMKAVIYLNNFWEWSGGMVTYLYWTNGGEFINMNDPENPWPAFAVFAGQFYRSDAANDLYQDYIRAIVSRTNSITGQPYTDDPAIMAWQLANEPRPGGGTEEEDQYLPDYYSWVDETAGLIKSLDENHLVSTGSEGTKGCAESEACYLTAHSSEHIDYLTVHLWPANWGWWDPENMAATWDEAAQKSRDYINAHIAYAEDMNMPLALEEFGLNRDDGEFSPEASTDYKDRFYSLLFTMIEDSAADGEPLVGSNFWAWGGEARAKHDDWWWQNGDNAYMGDPPQEPQGLYSVFDADDATLAIIENHADTLASPSEP